MPKKVRLTLVAAGVLIIVNVFYAGHAVARDATSTPIGWPWHVEIDAGRFHVDGEEVPSGCLQRLMTELNGDDIIQSVYLTRSSVRGCMAANIPGEEVRYSILSQQGNVISQHENNVFVVEVCERVDGSMGASCDELILQFRARRYIVGDEFKGVLVLEKLGRK